MNYSDTSIAATTPFLSLESVRKTYPGVVALDGFSMEVRPGEVIGLVGENGAGKSTLMKILGGVTTPDTGTITVDGVAHHGLTVEGSLGSGIAFVHQELNLFENLDVAANIFFGREPLHGGPLRLVDRGKLRSMVAPLLKRVGANFSADTPVSSLSLRARLVIMDEPTSSLTLAETARLMRVIADLKAEGVTIILVTHRLHEIVECADRVVVLRDGQVVGELARREISHTAMIRLMIGRDLKALYIPPAVPPGENALEIVDARTSTYPHNPVSLSVRRGEILGLAGLMGAGRTELARAVFGIDRLLDGTVSLDGKRLVTGTPNEAITRGIFLVPEDRKRSGIVLDSSIAENIALPNLMAYASAGLVSAGAIAANAETQKKRLNVRAPDVGTQVGSLSGGNQQKVVLAKWLSLNPRVLICDEPTRGIDVGAKQEIYQILRNLADAGVAILMISSDMEEVIGVSDRIAVMHEGQISGFLERPQFSEHNVLHLAVGNRPN